MADSPDLDITIDRRAEIPICVQLGWGLRARIQDGRLKPGQRLPGLRDMAEATGVNINTVRSAYQRLERAGLIDSHQGSGTFVAPAPPPRSAAATIAADAAREAQATGVDPREVAAALYVARDTTRARDRDGAGDDSSVTEGEAERRRALRAQIAVLERAIGEIEAEHPGVAPPPTPTRRSAGPTLLGGRELEQVRSALVRRLAAVQAAIDERSEPRPGPRRKPSTQKADAPVPAQPKANSARKRPRSTGRPATAGT